MVISRTFLLTTGIGTPSCTVSTLTQFISVSKAYTGHYSVTCRGGVVSMLTHIIIPTQTPEGD